MKLAPRFVRLPLTFDAAALVAEVAALKDDAWVAHFNADYHNGGWSGVALRAADGDSGRLFVDAAAAGSVQDTALLALCPGLMQALASFECPLRAVRLLRLVPGGNIDLHNDPDLRFDAGEARLHVALATNDAVEFYVDGEQVIMAPGECWYLDLSRPHRVANRGATDRIHLVVDAVVNDWLIAQIAAGEVPHRVGLRPSGASEFDRFRQAVFESRRSPLACVRRRRRMHSSRFRWSSAGLRGATLLPRTSRLRWRRAATAGSHSGCYDRVRWLDSHPRLRGRARLSRRLVLLRTAAVDGALLSRQRADRAARAVQSCVSAGYRNRRSARVGPDAARHPSHGVHLSHLALRLDAAIAHVDGAGIARCRFGASAARCGAARTLLDPEPVRGHPGHLVACHLVRAGAAPHRD
jgi:hypothetical protein